MAVNKGIGSDYGKGIYVLTVWSNAAQVDRAKLIQNIQNNYGDEYIESLGKGSAGINFGVLQTEIQNIIDSGASAESPTMADINGAIVKTAGYTPSALEVLGDVIGKNAVKVSNATVEGAGEILGAAKTGLVGLLNFLPIILIVGGIAYLAWNTGILKNAAKSK